MATSPEDQRARGDGSCRWTWGKIKEVNVLYTILPVMRVRS